MLAPKQLSRKPLARAASVPGLFPTSGVRHAGKPQSKVEAGKVGGVQQPRKVATTSTLAGGG